MKIKKVIPNDLANGTRHVTNNYGEVRVLSYIDSLNVVVEFVDTGFIITKTSRSIRQGTVKDPLKPITYGVGFIGVGKYTTGTQGIPNKSYQTWKGILARCYCSKCQKKHPTYIGCTVDPIWHNYQNFAKWYDAHYKPNLQIDKDKLLQGNKVYSPDTCIFLSREENTEISLAKKWDFVSPEGKHVSITNLAKFCKQHNLNKGNMIIVHRGGRHQAKGWTRYV